MKKSYVLTALLACSLASLAAASETNSAPLLEFASGLPGQQVRLTWPSEAGLRYRIEKSTTLAATGQGAWSQVALFEADGVDAVWVDPEATTTRAFYRVSQPQIEVLGISPPLLSTTGGTLNLLGQCIPAGSVLILEIDGQAPISIPISSLGGGVWEAVIAGNFSPGARVIAARIEDGSGSLLLTLGQPLTVTATGRADDSPPSLPPAAPMASLGDGVDDDCDGWVDDALNSSFGKKGYDYYKAMSDNGSAALIAAFSTKKGYDYYKAASDTARAGAHTNPYFVENTLAGEMSIACPSPSGLPGEVSFQFPSLSLPCPAGPPLVWTCTYRSMKPVSSGHGDAWDFSYNISIQPLPASDGASASRVVVRDGGGRADIFHRQANGTYRCDGMFREGSFTGDVFTLTFADQGTWTFHALDGTPDAGKIATIADRNGVALTCTYDVAGQLASVGDAFDRSLVVEWDSLSPPRIASVSSKQNGAAVFAKTTFSYSANERRLTAISSPTIPGRPPVAGNTTFAYATGSPDPRLNDNLLSVTDGAGRLMEAFTYSGTNAPGDISYDTCASHDRNRIGNVGQVCRTSFALLSGGYTMTENDELGRVCETSFDRQHRVLSRREYTGFATPGVEVTATNNRPTGKLRATDPDFFETTCEYNSDSRCVAITCPDGSRKQVTYSRDLKPDCPVLERGNARVVTLLAPGGESRTVTCDHLPGFGAPESARPGNPIGGLTIKGGRNPGGAIKARGGLAPGAIIGIAIGALHLDDDDDCDGISAGGARGQATGKRQHKPISVGALNDGRDNDCDGILAVISPRDSASGLATGRRGREVGSGMATGKRSREPSSGLATGRRIHEPSSGQATGRRQHQPVSIGSTTDGRDDDCDGFVTRMTSSLGQTSTWTYDVHGNCTAALSPLPGRGTVCEYDGFGRPTSVTTLNGAASSFRDEFNYDGDTGFLRSVVCDSTGLQLTTTCVRDDQGRVTSVVDPRGNDWLFAYNPLHQCVSSGTPAAPTRITTTFIYDAGSRLARCDTDHLAPDGSPVAANPLYTTFYVHDVRGRLALVANEERPFDAIGMLTPTAGTLVECAVCHLIRDDGGQITSITTPASSRAQTTDLVCEFTYDERGMLHHCIAGGAGSPAPVTTECDYDSLGALVRCATLGNGVANSETLYAYDGFHRPTSITDPMGNVTTYSYANNGLVTCSVFGEVNDVPGSAGNVLLSRASSLSFPASGGPLGPVCLTLDGLNDVVWDINPSSTTRRRVEVLKSNKQGDPNANRYDFGASPFFNVEVEDDVFTVERFSPGDAGPHATETTVVDRSPAGLVQSVSCNGDLLLSCTYDSAGRSATCSNGACTITTTRDANGNVTACGKTDHFIAVGAPPDKTFSVARVFDPLNRCVQTTDGSGNVTQSAYDSLGRCVSLTEPGGLVVATEFDGGTAASPFSSRVSCDLNGDGTPEILASSLVRCGELVSTTDSYGYRTSNIRDSLGRVTRCDHPDSTFETWSYDSLGRNDAWVCPDNSVRTIIYDANDRPLQVSWTSPQGVAPSSPTHHLWDGLGRCVSFEQDSSVVVCAYDSVGNPVSDTTNGATVTRTFNHRGRTAITYPDGTAFVEGRSPLGLPLSISALDATGLPVSPPVVAMEYAGERVWRSIQANGVVTTRVFRGDGEQPQPGGNDSSFDACVRVTTSDASTAVLSDVVHRRDANQREIRRDTLFTSSPQGPGRSQVFTLDALGRVTGCVTQRREQLGAPPVVESDVAYTIDLEGRRLTATGGSNPGSYTQNAAIPPGDRQMGQYTTWPGGPLTWDDRGNLASFTSSAGPVDYLHDAEGRLIALNDPATGSSVLSYEYDAIGRRSARVDETGKTTRFLYDGDVCIQEIGADSNPNATFVCVGGIQVCISTRNGTLYYPHGGGTQTEFQSWGDPHENLNGKHLKDWQGKQRGHATTLVTDAAGAPFERFDYDDTGGPVFLEADGSVSVRSSAIGPIRWMAPESIWEPDFNLFLGTDSVYSPPLGMTVSRHRGHVTVLKSPADGGGHVTVLKISAGGGGSGGASPATDHNSSRSNKTSS